MNNGINWKTFFVSVLGTAIGVALTFSLNGVRGRIQKEQAQRLTAIMVIHDIDETIENLKSLRDQEQRFNEFAQRALDNIDNLESVPLDTLYDLANILTRPDVPFSFNKSKETMFNSSLESWHSLGDIKFMDNIQGFYSSRQQLQDLLDKSPIWLEPIKENVYYQILSENGKMGAEEYHRALAAYLKDKLKDRSVTAFISFSDERVSSLTGSIDTWTKLNDENKFIMGITDSEMEEYIKSMKENGIPVTAGELPGRWVYSLEDGNSSEYEFRKDRSFTLWSFKNQLWYATYWTGKYKSEASVSGTWELKGDSLFLYQNPATAEYRIDTSEMTADKGKEDSLARWTANFQENSIALMKEQLEADNLIALKARMDSSHDKMGWSRRSSSSVIYVKRKIED